MPVERMRNLIFIFAVTGIALTVFRCIYILTINHTDNSIIDVIFFSILGSAPYTGAIMLYLSNKDALIPGVLIVANIILVLALHVMFAKAGTVHSMEWSLLMIPIYQMIGSVVLLGIFYLRARIEGSGT